ncbi:MAG: hypothetical protein RDU89_00800 [bacterium]|nr:hypothetical protein [bacterium]
MLVMILGSSRERRGLRLGQEYSRCLVREHVHEVILTKETGGPGSVIDRVAYLGFVRIENSGVVLVGDHVLWRGRALGRIAGFDGTHAPNHLNLVVTCTDECGDGISLGARLLDPIVFSQAGSNHED